MIRELISNFFDQMGFLNLGWENYVMIALSCVLIFLAIVKGFEPYLLIPIAVGMLLVNLDPTLMAAPVKEVGANGVTEVVSKGGLLWYLHEGVSLGIFPPLIFLGIGASTDFGPLIANPKSLILGAAAQVGIFITFLGALLLGFNGLEAASIGIIVASIILTYITDDIAERLHLGSGLAGALFLGVATSLPEVTSTISLFRMRNFDIAFGNIAGSNVFNYFVLAIADVLYSGGSVYHFGDEKVVNLTVFGLLSSMFIYMLIRTSRMWVKVVCGIATIACYFAFLML